MEFISDIECESWLFSEPGFQWDEGNREKNRKHGVSSTEVEEVFAVDLVLAGRIVVPIHDETRWLVLGSTQDGRNLAVIFTRRGDLLRPISARAMRQNERRLFEELTDE